MLNLEPIKLKYKELFLENKLSWALDTAISTIDFVDIRADILPPQNTFYDNANPTHLLILSIKYKDTIFDYRIVFKNDECIERFLLENTYELTLDEDNRISARYYSYDDDGLVDIKEKIESSFNRSSLHEVMEILNILTNFEDIFTDDNIITQEFLKEFIISCKEEFYKRHIFENEEIKEVLASNHIQVEPINLETSYLAFNEGFKIKVYNKNLQTSIQQFVNNAD